MEKIKTYLTEEKLGIILSKIYLNENIIHDKKISEHKNLCRPDYRLPNLKLIFEFDGSNHYTSSKRIIADQKNDEFYKSLGYRVIRIPYFIQLNTDFYKYILNIERESDYDYSNGFIDPKAILPADFCSLGIKRFNTDINTTYNYCIDEIKLSLKNKVLELKDNNLVYFNT